MAYAYKKGGKWYVGFRDEFGNQVQKRLRVVEGAKDSEIGSKGAKKLAEREEAIAERVRLGLEVREKPIALTLGQLWEKWSEAKSLNASADTDETRWRVHLKERFADVAASKLSPVELEAFLLSKLKEKGGDLSIQSVRHLRLLTGRMYRWAIKKGLLTGDNPAARVELPQLVEREPEIAAPGVVAFLASAPEPYRTIYAIAIYAGLRSDEILGLQPEQVDLQARMLVVKRQGKRESTKSGKLRVIPIVPQLEPLLRDCVKGKPAGVPLFVFPFKRAHCRQHILRKLYKLLTAAGLPLCTVHELRHTFGTQLSESGLDPRAVQALMGHADLKTTQRYVHHRSDYLAAQMAKLSYSSPVEATQKEAKA